MTFTNQELDNFRRYECVRKSGMFNMYMPDARRATKLSREEYYFTMSNYAELKKAVEAKEQSQ